MIKQTLRNLLTLLFFLGGLINVFAGELPVLTTDTSDPIFYRIKNTCRAAQSKATYWTASNGLSTNKSDGALVYFTGSKSGSVLTVKIHLKGSQNTLTADYKWAANGIDWYMKEFTSAQGGGYTGVLISNASTFPNVNNDKMADDGLGCWYVGSSNTSTWLYGGQWDGSIFTCEIDDPSRLDEVAELNDLPFLTTDTKDPIIYRIQNTRRAAQGKASYWTVTNGLTASRESGVQVYFTGVKEGKVLKAKIHLKDSPNTLTANFKWSTTGIDWYIKEFTSAQGGGYTGVLISNAPDFPNAYNDVANDNGLGCWYVSTSNTSPWLYGGQWDGSIFTCELDDPSRIDYVELAKDELISTVDYIKQYKIGSGIGQYSGADTAPLIAEAEAYIAADDCTVKGCNTYKKQLLEAAAALIINLPSPGSEMRLYCPALGSYVAVHSDANRMVMVSDPNDNTVFVYDGKNLINKATGLYTATYELKSEETTDQVTFRAAYGDLPGLYTIEYNGGEKERCLMAAAPGSYCDRHYLSSQSGYNPGTASTTAFEIDLLNGSVNQYEDVTSTYIVNPSFETGTTAGWLVTTFSNDVYVKPNSDGTFTCTGCDGQYLFNTWYQADSYVGNSQNQFVYQTIKGLQPGEYRLVALAASNTNNSVNTPVTLFVNDFTSNFVPQNRNAFGEYSLDGIFITEEVKSVMLGMRSASWFKADNFRLYYLGESNAYKEYVRTNYSGASIQHPVMFDSFDGTSADGFTCSPIGDVTPTAFPSKGAPKASDKSVVEASAFQYWTSAANTLVNSTVGTSYANLPNGYYRISSTVRVYDDSSYNGSVQGLSFYANDVLQPITNGPAPTAGNKTTKGFIDDYSVIAKVTDGTLETGFRIEDCNFNWLSWQNFRVEYIGTSDPIDELVNFNFPAGSYVPVCLPYAIDESFFGPIFRVAEVVDGKAVLVPSAKAAAGVPCVVKATGENPAISIGQLDLDFNAASSVLTLWNNTLLRGTFDGYTWDASLITNKTVKGSDLQYEEADLEHLNFTATIENRAAQRFWADNPNYTTSQASVIGKYLNEPTWARRDQPNPIVVPVVPANKVQYLRYSLHEDMSDMDQIIIQKGQEYGEIYNPVVGAVYYFKVASGPQPVQGQFKVDGTLRMLYVGPNVYNARDLGGKKTVDGRYVQYGKIFRTGELNGGYVATTTELKTLRKAGVGAEIDLRGELDNSGAGTSAFGYQRGTTYYYVGGDHYIADTPYALTDGNAEAKTHWKAEFEFVVENLRAGRGIDFHCRIGADRTGMLALMLEGILGVKEADLLRDYETTSFSTAAGTRSKDGNAFNLAVNYFKDRIPSGGTLRDAVQNYFTGTLHIDKSLIDEFRELMLTDTLVPASIESIMIDEQTKSQSPEGIYDLTGRRLTTDTPLPHGLYIINGKKVMR